MTGSPGDRPHGHRSLTGLAQAGLVLGGYVVAFMAAAWVAGLWIAWKDIPPDQASGGMQAFGDLLHFLAAFGVLAIVPTGMALCFLRPHRRFWTVLSAVALGLAATGFAAGLLYVLGSGAAPEPGASSLAMWASYAVLRLLLAPLLAGLFALSALFAPDRRRRWILLIAAAIEGAGLLAAILRLLLQFGAR